MIGSRLGAAALAVVCLAVTACKQHPAPQRQVAPPAPTFPSDAAAAGADQRISTLPSACSASGQDAEAFPYAYMPAARRCAFAAGSDPAGAGRFKTLRECMTTCGAAGPDVCRGLPQTGCPRVDLGWWFNRDMNRCEPYEYHCLGGDNSFYTAEDCQAACGGATVAPARGCPVHKPTGSCSSSDVTCLYDVASLCRCNQFSRSCQRETTCKPNVRQVELVRRCRESGTRQACAAAGDYMSAVPWSCSCNNGQWSCSRLAGGDVHDYFVKRD